MIKLNIWLTLPKGEILQAGELVVADPDMQGRLQGRFRYHPAYLDRSESFSLDPVHLPLSVETFDANRPQSGVHGVFEDSLPDDWGRRILARRYNLNQRDQRVPQLLQLLGGQGLGALSYSRKKAPDPEVDVIDERWLEDLQRLAGRFEEDATSIDDEMALLFQAGSSPGGARPKALIMSHGISYLAKFASIRDQHDVVALEAATMELATLAGVETARTKLVPCGARKVLLVKRFDINDGGGRNHLISMQTLLNADGYYNAGYRDMAAVMRQVSDNPGRDLQKLFRQMLFNVMIGNTDDHLKNFCMLYDGSEWQLSPAFDLVPNIGGNREHVLRIGSDTVVQGRNVLLEEAKFFGIKQRKKTEEIIDAVFSAVSDWRKVFQELEVPRSDIEKIGRDIEGRLSLIKKS